MKVKKLLKQFGFTILVTLFTGWNGWAEMATTAVSGTIRYSIDAAHGKAVATKQTNTSTMAPGAPQKKVVASNTAVAPATGTSVKGQNSNIAPAANMTTLAEYNAGLGSN